MIKAELELMKGEREECGFDLDKVRNLLELCTGTTLLTYSNDCGLYIMLVEAFESCFHSL